MVFAKNEEDMTLIEAVVCTSKDLDVVSVLRPRHGK